jgi:hypothetical protein
MTIIEIIRKKLFSLSVERKIKKANKLHKLTGHKYIVYLYKGKPVIKAKKDIKKLIQRRVLQNITIQQIEQKAIYVTL